MVLKGKPKQKRNTHDKCTKCPPGVETTHTLNKPTYGKRCGLGRPEFNLIFEQSTNLLSKGSVSTLKAKKETRMILSDVNNNPRCLQPTKRGNIGNPADDL